MPAASDIAPIYPASPFARLRALLDDAPPPNTAPISLAVGAPSLPPPDFVLQALAKDVADYGRYPPIEGVAEWRTAVQGWLGRRFALDAELLEAPAQILPVNGTREALFLAAQLAPPKSADYLAQLLDLARHYKFIILLDECYSDILATEMGSGIGNGRAEGAAQ